MIEFQIKKTTLSMGLFLLVFGVLAQDKSGFTPPNIIVILADDFGYGSTNMYGAEKQHVRTPNIDRLANEGMLFTDASTPASICTPTRIGLLTGQYPWRSKLKFGVVNPLDPLILDPDDITLADLLNDRGYQTAAIGKWHLGYGNNKEVDFTKKLSPGPLDMGFDYHFGVPQNHGDVWGVYVENDHIYGQRTDQVTAYSRTFYSKPYVGIDAPQRVNKDVTPELAEKAIDWIKNVDPNDPFFLYFAAVAVHRPITPSDDMRGMSGCGPYGDFIQDLDQSVGRILDVLDYMNIADNTLIFFTSDNGGQLPDKRTDAAEELYARDLGFLANGKLKGDKHTIWEGGTRVPFIVRWPGNIQPGTTSDNMINLTDIFSTVHEVLDDRESYFEGAGQDSYSFLKVLLGKDNSQNRPAMVTAEVSGMQAIRMDGWKYIDDTQPEGLPAKKAERLTQTFKPQLYNLSEDPSESKNLYDDKPEMVKKLSEELNKLRKQPSRK
ncbi:MAG: sulfatase-like hydrolase/transferase [Cyclobacteriaceae bacterium]